MKRIYLNKDILHSGVYNFVFNVGQSPFFKKGAPIVPYNINTSYFIKFIIIYKKLTQLNKKGGEK